MEDLKKKAVGQEGGDKDIIFWKAIKAGKRIYYLDVKRNRRGELYLCITESKKITQGDGPEAPFTFDKHKIFLYKEDFDKFRQGLEEVVEYIKERCPVVERVAEESEEHNTSSFSNVNFEEL